MSLSELRGTSERWLQTARDDLRAARVLAAAALHAHACFSAQQAAEKAVKSVWYRLGDDPWGHSVQKLLRDLQNMRCPADLISDAAMLDRYYIPTRYPDGLPDLTPNDNYNAADSADAIVRSARIIDWCADDSRPLGDACAK